MQMVFIRQIEGATCGSAVTQKDLGQTVALKEQQVRRQEHGLAGAEVLKHWSHQPALALVRRQDQGI